MTYERPKDNNNNANIEAFISELTPKIQSFLKSKADVILCGDFNIHVYLLQINNRPAFSEYFDTLLTKQFLSYYMYYFSNSFYRRQLHTNYTCGLDRKYRVLVSVVCLSVCVCVCVCKHDNSKNN